MRAGAAVAAAHDRLVVVERVDHEARLGAELGHAEQDALAAPVEQVDGVADQGRVADALEGVVDAVGQAEVLHRLHELAVAGERGAVEEVGGAELAGDRLLARVGVDHDDAAGGAEAGRLDDGLADAAGADHHDGLARLHLGPVEHRAGAGDDRAADEARRLERHLLGDHDGLALGHDGALGEHAGVGELEGLLPADGERAGSGGPSCRGSGWAGRGRRRRTGRSCRGW